jgi:DNA-directed RNA polymerase subunit K/omega
MRSEYVFAAAKEISNRFMLCRVTSVSARRLQIGFKHPAESINESLRLIAASELSEHPIEEVTEANKEPIVAALAGTSLTDDEGQARFQVSTESEPISV